MGFFSNIFREKKPQNSFANLLVDVHSHLLPGIDDGAKSMDDSLAMIRMLIDMGYQKLIITPHVMAHMYPNSTQHILQVFHTLQTEVMKQQLPITLEIAAEYYLDETLFSISFFYHGAQNGSSLVLFCGIVDFQHFNSFFHIIPFYNAIAFNCYKIS
jgi:hypothetical protein